jgi:hypothetical protein
MKGSNNNNSSITNKNTNSNIAKLRAQNLTEKVNLDRVQNTNNNNFNQNNININQNMNNIQKINQIKLDRPQSENYKHQNKPSFNSQNPMEINLSKDYESNPIGYQSKKKKYCINSIN